jgi:hypothetical protein
MRRLFAQLIVLAVTAFAVGVAYRYLWDDPSEANLANYLRSGLHPIGLAASGLGAHLYFNARLSGRLRRWPLFAEIALRAVVMAIAVSAVAAGLQVTLYDRRPESTWFFTEFPRIVCDYLRPLGAFWCGLRTQEADRRACAPQCHFGAVPSSHRARAHHHAGRGVLTVGAALLGAKCAAR